MDPEFDPITKLSKILNWRQFIALQHDNGVLVMLHVMTSPDRGEVELINAINEISHTCMAPIFKVIKH